MTRQPGTLKTTVSRKATCKVCHSAIDAGDECYKITTTSTYYYICDKCHSRIMPYSTRNSKVNNKSCKHGITIGIEHEQSGSFDYRALYVMGWVPTSDCTVNVEYKSPIFQSLRGLKLTLQTLEKAGATSGDDRSGTHCHVGTFSSDELSTIQSHAIELFDALQNVLYNDRIGTTEFFGRYFTSFAGRTEFYSGHSVWLNLYTGKPTIELRLGKFQNAQQYYKVLVFASMLGRALKSFCTGDISASKASNKILSLYRKCRLARDISDIIGNNNRS